MADGQTVVLREPTAQGRATSSSSAAIQDPGKMIHSGETPGSFGRAEQAEGASTGRTLQVDISF